MYKSELKLYKLFFFCLIFFCGIAMSCINENKLEGTAVRKMIREQYPTVLQISTQQLAQLLSTKDAEKPILLDVRGSHEYAISHLQNALKVATKEEAVEILKNRERDELIVVYCSVGFRSCNLAKHLKTIGYKRVYNLEGGIFKWANEGHSVFNNGQQATHIHPFSKEWGHLLKKSLCSPVPTFPE